MSAAFRGEDRPRVFSGALVDILDRVEYRRVDPHDLDDPVYRLRYEAYRREEFIPFNSAGILQDRFEDDPNAYCFGVYIDGTLASSIRIHHLTPDCRRSATYAFFGDILDPMLDRGCSFIDPSRFSVDHEMSLAYPALPFLTLRLTVMAIRHFDATYGIHTVRPEHGPFYKRIWGAKLIAKGRSQPPLTFTMDLWMTEARSAYDGALKRFPLFNSTPEERHALFGPNPIPVRIPASSPAALAALG